MNLIRMGINEAVAISADAWHSQTFPVSNGAMPPKAAVDPQTWKRWAIQQRRAIGKVVELLAELEAYCQVASERQGWSLTCEACQEAARMVGRIKRVSKSLFHEPPAGLRQYVPDDCQ